MRAQQIGELTDRSGRMADGPKCRLPRHEAVWHRARRIATGREKSGSIRRQFFGIDFEKPQSAVGDGHERGHHTGGKVMRAPQLRPDTGRLMGCRAIRLL